MKDEDILLPEMPKGWDSGVNGKFWELLSNWMHASAGREKNDKAQLVEFFVVDLVHQQCREAVRMNQSIHQDSQQAKAWAVVYEALNAKRTTPPTNNTSGIQDALAIIDDLVARAKPIVGHSDTKLNAAVETLEAMGYTHTGGVQWRPPLGERPVFDDQPRPFDLEAAKRGEPLVMRDGRKARFVAHVPELDDGHRVIVVRDGNSKATAYYDNGRSRFGKALDLFLAPKPKRTVWVNVRRDQVRHDSAKFAQQYAETHGLSEYIATAVPIQIDDVGAEE